jgi:hypothetical protein
MKAPNADPQSFEQKVTKETKRAKTMDSSFPWLPSVKNPRLAAEART